MMIRKWLCPMGLVFTVLLGCNQAPVEQANNDTNETATTQEADEVQQPELPTELNVTPTSTGDPEQSVTLFLHALRMGDQDVAENMLTEKARSETAKLELVVEPPGTPEVKYDVAEVEYHGEDEAHVLSNWREPSDGGDLSYQVVWITRRQPVGWRIAGMATKLEGSEGVLIDFEDAESMAVALGVNEETPETAPTATADGSQTPSSPVPATATSPTNGLPSATVGEVPQPAGTPGASLR